MPTNVLMPQMGESIAEGTIVRWIKKVGETVDRDEPLFEISTDKVDAEIPSPSGGVLAEIRAQVGETVPVNSVVAVIAAEGETVVPAPAEGDTVEEGRGSSPSARPDRHPGRSPAHRHPAEGRRWCGNSPPSTTSIWPRSWEPGAAAVLRRLTCADISRVAVGRAPTRRRGRRQPSPTVPAGGSSR